MAERDLVDDFVDSWRRELPEVVGPDLGLAKRVARLSVLLGDAADEALAEHGLTRAEYEILAGLRAQGRPYRRKPAELSKTLLLSTGGTSNVLQRLAASELVAREPDPDDRRSSWVRLTPRGVRLTEQLVRETTAAHADVLASLPEATKERLGDLLREVLLAVDPIHRRHRARY